MVQSKDRYTLHRMNPQWHRTFPFNRPGWSIASKIGPMHDKNPASQHLELSVRHRLLWWHYLRSSMLSHLRNSMHRIWSCYTLPGISGFLEPWCKLPWLLRYHSECQQTSPMQMMTPSTTDWTVAWASWTTVVAPPEWSNFIYLILFIGQGYDFFFISTTEIQQMEL